MSLRYALLGMLANESSSGYDLNRRFQEALYAIWPASHPQIYSELKKLDADALVTFSKEGSRGRKVYTITPKGLKSVQSWLAHSDVDHALRSDSLLRSYFFWIMEPATLQKHLAAEKAFFESRVAQYEQFAAAKDRGDFGSSPQMKSIRITLEAGIRLYKSLAGWAEWASKEIEHPTSSNEQ